MPLGSNTRAHIRECYLNKVTVKFPLHPFCKLYSGPCPRMPSQANRLFHSHDFVVSESDSRGVVIDRRADGMWYCLCKAPFTASYALQHHAKRCDPSFPAASQPSNVDDLM
jgi:hypothetical protein